MLTGPSRSILARSRAMASSALSALLLGGDDGRVGSRRASSVDRRPASSPAALVLRLVQIGRRRSRARRASRSPAASSAATSASTSSSVDLHGVDAGLREVRQVALGRGARDVELGDRRAQRVVRTARRRGCRPRSRRRRARSAVTASSASRTVSLQRVERAHVGVELRLALDHRERAAPRRARSVVSRSAASVDGPDFELRERLLEPLHFGRQRDRTLDQAGVRRAGFRRAAAQVLRRLARLEQPPLGHGQPLVGRALLAVEAIDRRARLLLPPIERVALVFGLPALARQLLGLLGQARLFVDRAPQLRLRGRRWPSPGGDARRAARRSRSDASAIVRSSAAVSSASARQRRRARRRAGRAGP